MAKLLLRFSLTMMSEAAKKARTCEMMCCSVDNNRFQSDGQNGTGKGGSKFPSLPFSCVRKIVSPFPDSGLCPPILLLILVRKNIRILVVGHILVVCNILVVGNNLVGCNILVVGNILR